MRQFTICSILFLLLGNWSALCAPPNLATLEEAAPQPTPVESELPAEAIDEAFGEIEEIVFAERQPGKDGHWYANFSYYATDTNRVTYGNGGRLCRLNPRTQEMTFLLEDPGGGIRDPQVHYDAQKILFSYRRGGEPQYNLYEINLDGTGLKQITTGPWDDIEPTYLPDDGILFCSSRCKRWVNCWLTQVANLYRCDGNGRHLTQVSSNGEHDNTPWPLPDGRILYQRWEYVDRSQVHYHHLWTMNPDGTGQMVYYGNMHPGIVMIDAKPIPGTDRVLAIFSPGHGRKEHDGAVTVLDPSAGPDEESSTLTIQPSKVFRDPYPLSGEFFLVARRHQILLMDRAGSTRVLYSLPSEAQDKGFELHEPRPLRTRPRERVIPPRTDLSRETGRLVLADVYKGRNMEGVKLGDIKKLLVLESLPKPINFTGGMEPLSYGGTFTLERILGTVPVDADGSAYLEVPALRSLFFVALDEDDLSVKRMQSFLTVQPGETQSCVGCHEQRTSAHIPAKGLLATARSPSRIEPIRDVPEVFDFPRDIQPILDKRCVACHDYKATKAGGPRAGNVILTGDRGPLYSHSYFTLSARRQVADGRNRAQSNYPPRGIGSSASPLIKKLEGSHYGVVLDDRERRLVRLWIDTGATYPGTYASLGSGMIGGYEENRLDRSDMLWPSMREAMASQERRCATCHSGELALPTSPSDDLEMPPWDIRYDDPRLRFSRHILYNLSRPENSLLLLAPLSKKAGGYGICRAVTDAATGPSSISVFEDLSDADYNRMLGAIRETKAKLEEIKRFDMVGFTPRPAYFREMKRYGILPVDLDSNRPIDTYAADRAYWESLWYRPGRSSQ